MRCPAEVKARLLASGEWERFCKIRDDHKAGGASPKDAHMMALGAIGEVEGGSGGKGLVELSKSQFDVNRKVSALSVVQWIFESIDVLDLEPAEAPSAGAWSLLVRLRKNPGALMDFYTKTWAKTLPSRTQVDHTDRFSDNGEKPINALDKLDRVADEIEQSVLFEVVRGVEGSAEESGVSASVA